MLNIQSALPFHHQYPRPQTMSPNRKEQETDKPASFHDILTRTMNEKTKGLSRKI
ncbi:hypothetical protein JJQ72_15035 [Paenibacillus sp. F411]|uniref:hypothetical protein n=1 Tax=Paenibacillus sp. F411 TaxID=2820239 RepID=UPI001AB01445|nr:hypothetical protein [Paenibacillus sp. F411]MBO2945289.1 hypothetical protein [Paenibacillus sp. F411]